MSDAQTEEAADSDKEGGCVCGKVRYRVGRPPLVVHCCHCTWCQRETGSGFAVNALLEADELTLLAGRVEEQRIASASGAGQKTWRCEDCKTVLWSCYAIPGVGERLRFLRVGTLDTPSDFPPDVHIYVDSKASGVKLDVSAVRFPGYYRFADVWKPESLRRLACLKAAVSGETRLR